MTKKVLLINPSKQDNFVVTRIHMGLTLIAEILKQEGHQVRVLDYAYLRHVRGIKIPPIENEIHDFKPDVIGISVFTYLYDEVCALIPRIAEQCVCPIILGGPHFSVFPSDFAEDPRISYILKGEVECEIGKVVRNATKNPRPIVIDCAPPAANMIPPVNLDSVVGSQHLSAYQIQLSRGCPFNCSFCIIRSVASRQIRSRDIEECLQQIIEAKRKYPGIRTVNISDDCPTLDKDRFKYFLRRYKELGICCELAIDNLRADSIDQEMIDLYVAAGGYNLCLGLESGNSNVFDKIHKGESLKEIVNAAALIKKTNLRLGLCFVIGLPGDNLRYHLSSIKLARRLKPDYIFWNMCIPWPRTEVGKWFEQNGQVGEIKNFSTLIDSRVAFCQPPASTTEFSKEERIKAWFLANLWTYCVPLTIGNFLRLLPIVHRYQLYYPFIAYLLGYFPHRSRTGFKWLMRKMRAVLKASNF